MMRTRFSLIALAGIFVVSGCKQQQPSAPELNITASDSAPKAASLPPVDPPLDRQALLLAASQAASNYALNKDDSETQKKLDGKRFAIRLRFGCGGRGSKAANAPRSWSFDEKRRVLSFKVELDVDLEQWPVAVPADASIEAVEGFWIERPWMLQAGCPRVVPAQVTGETVATDQRAKRADSPQAAPEMPSLSATVGIAQFFLDTEARTHRREHRAYETTKVLAEGVSPSREGYDLVVAGRLRRLTDGRVIVCRIEEPGLSPSCLVSIQLDNVSIEAPGSGGTVATWSGA